MRTATTKHRARVFTRVLLLLVGVTILMAGWLAIFKGSQRGRTTITPLQTNPPANANPGEITGNMGVFRILATARLLTQTNRTNAPSTLLDNLRTELNRMGVEAASVAISNYLDSHADASTGLGFKLAADGHLKEAPTLRLFLLDHLAQVNLKAAANYAERILVESSSPDEWAVSLRAYALGETGTDRTAFLQKKTRELLRNDSWRDNPSVGFLEAFDVVVFAGDHELTPDLAAWLRQTENRALAHAAYLTLDRLIQSEPAEMLERLGAQPELLAGREATRADFFARADVRDPRQRLIVENYLLDPNRSEAEWKSFSAVYPNANFMVSHNLLTQNKTPTSGDIVERDRMALSVVEEWLGDQRFANHLEQLEAIRTRLNQFVAPSAAYGTNAAR